MLRCGNLTCDFAVLIFVDGGLQEIHLLFRETVRENELLLSHALKTRTSQLVALLV